MADPNAALIDIVGPAAPAQSAGTGWPFVEWLLVALAIAALVVWIAVRLPVWRTRLALWRLRRAYQAGLVDTREASYRLAAELRRHYHLRRLDAASVSMRAGGDWCALLRRLDRFRYRPTASRTSPRQWRRLCDAAGRRLGTRRGRGS